MCLIADYEHDSQTDSSERTAAPMKLLPVPPDVAQTGLRVVKSVCLGPSGSRLSDLQAGLVRGIQKHILHTDIDVDRLDDISPEAVVHLRIEQTFRERIIRGAIIAACIDGEMDAGAVGRLERFAQALAVDLSPVKTAWKLANRHFILARVDIVRRSLPGVKLRETVSSQGLVATIKQFVPLTGGTLPDVAAKYRQLEQYAEGTLAHAFTDYLHRNGFPFPGEAGAGPEIIVVHDCLHVLGEYGTTATEEIEIAAFQAGCQFDDPIYGILFGLAQYHLNIQVAPVAPSQGMQADPEKMIAAFARGCRVNRDMWRDFDPWDYFHRPLTELRRDFGVPPKV